MSTTSSRHTRLAIIAAVLAAVIVAAVAFGVIAQSFAFPVSGSSAAPRASAPMAEGPISPFDDQHPAIANLRPELRAALQQAASAASEAGFELVVNSGWRTVEQQERLFEEAVAAHGSREEAARWVAPADRSTHVSGEAIDVGDLDASIWLGDNGRDFGLCRTYENERWHFEFRAEAIGGECPPPFLDASQDPRMH